MNDIEKFVADTKNVHGSRFHKVKNSYDTKDFYRNYIKGIDRQGKFFVTERQYGEILRITHDIITEKLLDGCQVVFPYCFGLLQIESHKNVIKFVDGKLRTSYMVDWDKTIRLWYEDEECRKNKTLVRNDNPNRYVVKYHRSRGRLANKKYLCFMPSRVLTDKINKKMHEEGLNVLPIIRYGTTE